MAGLEVVANSIAVVTLTLQATESISHLIQSIKNAPEQIRHLQGTCELLTVNLDTIRRVLQNKERLPTSELQPQLPYFNAIEKVVNNLSSNVVAIKERIPSQKDGSRGFWGKIRGSSFVNAVDMKLRIDPDALARIDRNISILHFTITNLSHFEQVPPPDLDKDALRLMIKQLATRDRAYGELTYRLNDIRLLPPPNEQEKRDYEALRSSAHNIVKNLAVRSLMSTPVISTTSLVEDDEPAASISESDHRLDNIQPTELESRYREALRVARQFQEQQFPDLAADFQQEAIETRSRLIDSGLRLDRFSDEVKVESRYVTILLECADPQRREEGERRLERLAHLVDRNNTEPSTTSDLRTLTAAREEIGQRYRQLGKWELVVQYLRSALFEGYMMESPINKDHVRRVARLISEAYEANPTAKNTVDRLAFRETIGKTIGFDPVSDPPDVRATLEWCRANGFPTGSTSESQSLNDLRDIKGNSPLHRAVCDPNISGGILRQLALSREAIDIQDENGLTALLLAVERSHSKAVTILVDEGASLFMRKPEADLNETVFHACRDPDILKFLLDQLVKRRPSAISAASSDSAINHMGRSLHVNSTNSLGSTALHKACERGDNKLVKVLLNAGADANAQSHSGETPLILASYNKRPYVEKKRVICELLRAKAEFGIQDKSGRTPADGLRDKFSKREIEQLSQMSQRRSSEMSRVASGSTTSSSPFTSLELNLSKTDLTFH